MSKFKVTVKKALDAIFNTRETTSLQEKNEIKANQNLAKCLFVLGLLMVFIYMCIFFLPSLSIPTDVVQVYVIIVPIVFFLMMAPAVWSVIKGVSTAYYKYLLLIIMIIAVGLCFTIVSSTMVLVWCLPLVFVMHYYNPKIVRTVFILTIIFMVITTFTSMFFGSWNSNMMGSPLSAITENTVAGRAKFLSTNDSATIHPISRTLLFFTFPNIIIITIAYIACNGLSLRTQVLNEEMMYTAIETERLVGEFNIASQIQNDALPKSFPTDKRIDVYAKMVPARFVGGDFYDFFYVDDDHFVFLVADTSGKGVSAAMFMMKAKTLIQSLSLSKQSLDLIIEYANKQLCLNNDSFMFVTSWIGVIDVRTGVIQYINAGHNFPVIKKRSGEVEFLKNSPNFFLGIKADAQYKVKNVKLDDGDHLLLYTDGVNEAQDINHKFYGNDRLINFASKTKFASSKEYVNGLYDNVTEFVGSAEVADDITLFAIKYNDVNSIFDINVTSHLSNVDKVTDFINNHLKEHNVERKIVMEIDMVIDEIFSNIVKYAYSPNIGDISTHVTFDEKDYVTITFMDSGKPFNPLTKNDPLLSDYKEFNKVGGLGIFITKKVMDSIDYKYIDNKNILILKKKI